jgi:hypothetical protein
MKCPTCFAHLQHEPRKLLCVGSCDPEVSPVATSVRGYEVRVKTVFDAPPPSDPGRPVTASCPKCGTPTSQEACEYCFGAIPAHWRLSKVTCVAMAGARATGKSLMLAVSKEQLALLFDRHHHSTFHGIGNTDEFFFRNYTQTLYEKRELMEPTASATSEVTTVREPMMFQFTERRPDGSNRLRILVLRDVAGEDLEARGGRDNSLGFYSRADAVVALIDPLTVPQIRALLADLVPGDTLIGGDGLAVLRHVIDLMGDGIPGARTPIPLAVVLSKVDTLQQLTEVKNTLWAKIMDRPGSPLQRDPSLASPGFDATDGDLLHAEVAGLLEELGARSLTAMLRDRVDTYHYFATSALGVSPEGKDVPPGGISPFRAVDPFKWILDVTG